MAKAKAKTTVDALIAGLKLAVEKLPDVLLLVGTKGNALFAKADADVAEQAVAAGYLTKRVVTTAGKGKGKAKSAEYGIVTEAGARKAFEGDTDVKAVLESLLQAVGKFPVGSETHNQPDVRDVQRAITESVPPIISEVEKAAQKAVSDAVAVVGRMLDQFRQHIDTIPTEVEKAVTKALPGGATASVRAALGNLERKVADALPANSGGPPVSTNPAPLFEAIQTAIGRLRVEPRGVEYALPPSSDAPASHSQNMSAPTPSAASGVADEIVAFVTNWAREKTVGPPFDEIMKHLRARHPSLTVGEFHDSLRRLAGGTHPRLRLSGWSKTIHELPEPELALFVKHTVSYYAHPVQ